MPEYPEICPTPARGRVKTGIEQQEAPRIGIRRKAKKRPRLFSPGRPGSPPPELPNYDLDSRVPPYTCKRHFGNGIGAAPEVDDAAKARLLLFPGLSVVNGSPNLARGGRNPAVLRIREFHAQDVATQCCRL